MSIVLTSKLISHLEFATSPHKRCFQILKFQHNRNECFQDNNSREPKPNFIDKANVSLTLKGSNMQKHTTIMIRIYNRTFYWKRNKKFRTLNHLFNVDVRRKLSFIVVFLFLNSFSGNI